MLRAAAATRRAAAMTRSFSSTSSSSSSFSSSSLFKSASSSSSPLSSSSSSSSSSSLASSSFLCVPLRRSLVHFEDARRRRLLYNVRKRGTRENIVLLHSFVAAHLGSLTDVELDDFERLLGLSDPDLFDVMMDRATPTDERLASADVVKRLQQFIVNGEPKNYE